MFGCHFLVGGSAKMAGLLVHEWIESDGGAEKVLDQFVKIAPKLDVLSLWNDDSSRYPEIQVHQSWMAKTPLRRRKALALPVMPFYWRHSLAREYDWALISSHLFSHHVRLAGPKFTQTKLAYVHTPARYIWAPELDARGKGMHVRTVAPIYRGLDKYRSAELSSIAANSEFVRSRIQQTWGRDAMVIYPPVAVEEILRVHDWSSRLCVADEDALSKLPETFIFGASRLVEYKKLEDVIRVGDAIGLPTVIAGDGPDLGRLVSLAKQSKVPVYFLGRISDELMRTLFQKCAAFIFPPIEDFGIVPVEALAAGAPVIGNVYGASLNQSKMAW
jgi:glycosyltransferase involved in cell wall biosynthesis